MRAQRAKIFDLFTVCRRETDPFCARSARFFLICFTSIRGKRTLLRAQRAKILRYRGTRTLLCAQNSGENGPGPFYVHKIRENADPDPLICIRSNSDGGGVPDPFTYWPFRGSRTLLHIGHIRTGGPLYLLATALFGTTIMAGLWCVHLLRMHLDIR